MKKLHRSILVKVVTVAIVAIFFVLFADDRCLRAQRVTDNPPPTPQRIQQLVNKAGDLYKTKDYVGSANTIRDAQKALVLLAKDSDSSVVNQLKNDYDRILKAQKLLVAQGEKFSKLPSFDSLIAATGSNLDDDDTADDDRLVSFIRTVAPIIVEHCGRCHIEQQLGKYSTATYDDLKKKSRKGIVVKPKQADESRLISLVESGEMPKKGDKLSDEQIQILKDWVNQGAKFDGDAKSKRANLTSFVSAPGPEGGSAPDSNKGTPSPNQPGGLGNIGGAD